MAENDVKCSWTVYWNGHSNDTYLYGSTILFHDKADVEFLNNMMPPGTVIKKWYSKTNYQVQHEEPALPIIDGESRYRIYLDVTKDSNEHILLRMTFYDRFDREVGTELFTDEVADFTCPLSTFSYSIELVNGGSDGFRFHRIIIQELLNVGETNTAKIQQNTKKD